MSQTLAWQSSGSEVAETVNRQIQRLQAQLRSALAECASVPLPQLVTVTTDVLSDEIAKREVSRVQNVTALAVLRGVARKEELKTAEGGHVSADVARTFLSLSKPAVLDRFNKGRLLGWREKNAVRFPLWQFKADGGLFPGITEVIQLLSKKPSYDEWARILFFLTPRHSLDDRRPLDLIRAGHLQEVIDLAQAEE